MLFNSLEYLLFFPLVVALYFALPFRMRWVALLAASYYFYMSWKAEYAVLILIATFVNYAAAIQIHRSKNHSIRKNYLVLSLVVSLGILFVFKYFNFFMDSASSTAGAIGLGWESPALRLLLPIGISFYTFQALSYTIDVYLGRQEPERHPGIFALYISFFPQLVAGPIERAGRLLPQFKKKHDFDYERVTDGLKLILWGFFKKLVIADRLAIYVNQVYGNPTDHTGLPLIIATYFFAFQIYCDFSGYSDIAIGSARVMGFDLMDNFNRPYFAKNPVEFWRRWHISLSTWFRDYLYIPLGGSRVSRKRLYLNLAVVFLITGLWHGAAWTFVVWGGIHGLYIIGYNMSRGLREKANTKLGLVRYPGMMKYVNVFVTFNLVSFAWIFFRANSMSDALYIAGHLFSGINAGQFTLKALSGKMVPAEFIIAVASILFMEVVHLIQRHSHMRSFLTDKPLWLRWPIYYILMFSILLLGVFGANEFIYFQF